TEIASARMANPPNTMALTRLFARTSVRTSSRVLACSTGWVAATARMVLVMDVIRAIGFLPERTSRLARSAEYWRRYSLFANGRISVVAVHIGTSGWSYAHWTNVLYPEGF